MFKIFQTNTKTKWTSHLFHNWIWVITLQPQIKNKHFNWLFEKKPPYTATLLQNLFNVLLIKLKALRKSKFCIPYQSSYLLIKIFLNVIFKLLQLTLYRPVVNVLIVNPLSFRCSSPVGRMSYGNSIKLARGCWGKGTVMHEIGHSIGLFHEQSRPDRDNYVNILWNNIKAGKFKIRLNESLIIEYNYIQRLKLPSP